MDLYYSNVTYVRMDEAISELVTPTPRAMALEVRSLIVDGFTTPPSNDDDDELKLDGLDDDCAIQRGTSQTQSVSQSVSHAHTYGLTVLIKRGYGDHTHTRARAHTHP